VQTLSSRHVESPRRLILPWHIHVTVIDFQDGDVVT
jgi:hypothetical protein